MVALAGIGAAVHVVPWLRDNRTDISLFLLMLLLTASGFTAALALITTYVDRPTPPPTTPDDRYRRPMTRTWSARNAGNPPSERIPDGSRPRALHGANGS